MASEDRNPEELRIVLVGDSGSGKSATGNTILRRMAFTIGQSWVPMTLTCQTERGEFEGRPVSVVDTPGTIRFNPSEMSKCISYCASGLHAFLLVIPQNKFTEVERHVKTLQRKFGRDASHYTIVLFSHGDELPDGVTAEQFIRQNQLPYGVGYHILNNRDEDPSQVKELMEKISTMVQRNRGSYYIKVKDWKQYLYPFATAVTIGGGIGAASGGTPGGVLVAAVGSAVGAIAAARGDTAVAVVRDVVVATLIGVAIIESLTDDGGFAGTAIVAMFGLLSGVSVGAGIVAGYVADDGVGAVVVAIVVAVAAALGLAVAIGDGVVAGAGIAGKATAAILAGAGTTGAAFEVFDDIDVSLEAILGIIGGAAVGAGMSAVGLFRHSNEDLVYLFVVGEVIVLFVLFRIVREGASIINNISGFAVVAGVSAGAAFGAAGGVLGASRFAAGTMIYTSCQAVAWWLNRKD